MRGGGVKNDPVTGASGTREDNKDFGENLRRGF